MSRTAWTIGACAASAALAYWVGARGAASPKAPAAARPAPAAVRVVTRPVLEAPVPGRGLTRDDVRAAIREELAARDDDARTPEAPDAPASDEVERAVSAARAAVSDGLRDGVWDEHNRVTLGARLAHLGPDDAARAIAPLFAAINAQQVDLRGPPL